MLIYSFKVGVCRVSRVVFRRGKSVQVSQLQLCGDSATTRTKWNDCSTNLPKDRTDENVCGANDVALTVRRCDSGQCRVHSGPTVAFRVLESGVHLDQPR
jgi:hypothetical protein